MNKSSTKKPLQNIPTNLITGFLGVGKTSTILHLMEQKPADERWSVLVNEFGSVGIDGAIYKAKGIDVKEIPGGCMCCAAGVPLQVAVNRILKETRPHRLLIEPSGLGHPKRVLDTLQGEHFIKVLSMHASICLIDPNNLSDSRYTANENFIDQIAIADVLVANKIDSCDSETMQQFDEFVLTLTPSKQSIIKTQFGKIEAEILNYISTTKHEAKYPFHHEHSHQSKQNNQITSNTNTIGFNYPKELVFDYERISKLLLGFKQEIRIKAVIHTNKGWKIFNIQNQQKQISDIEYSDDSRLEFIDWHAHTDSYQNTLEDKIKHCILY